MATAKTTTGGRNVTGELAYFTRALSRPAMSGGA